VPVLGLREVTVPSTKTGAGVKIVTSAAVAGEPVASMLTGTPSTSADTLTVAPPWR
jgi:hypothetical protein